MSTWSRLPNAKLLDWVIKDHNDHIYEWLKAWDYTFHDVEETHEAAFRAADNIGRMLISEVHWREASGLAACSAGLALIAYDHAGNLFDMPVEQVQVLAYLGQPAAILMLPACRIREKRRELSYE
jgi:hypothetical protein